MSLFLVAYFFRTDKLTDLVYGLTFVCMVLFGVKNANPRSWKKYVMACMVVLWACRLIGYLFIRVCLAGKDTRFDGIRESFLKFGGFWFLQAVSVWVILLPTMLFLLKRTDKVGWGTYVGLGIFLLGFLIETVADMQKWTFKQNPAFVGRWIETGLWRYSRHPNYFGEMLVWVGIWLYTLPVLRSSWVEVGIGMISPVYVTLLLVFLTGIPMLEASADKRWGGDKAYRAYKARTSVCIPWFPKGEVEGS
ncbi:MAG: DUF1295 domain-containing protein [Bacteroidota bacterium]